MAISAKNDFSQQPARCRCAGAHTAPALSSDATAPKSTSNPANENGASRESREASRETVYAPDIYPGSGFFHKNASQDLGVRESIFGLGMAFKKALLWCCFSNNFTCTNQPRLAAAA